MSLHCRSSRAAAAHVVQAQARVAALLYIALQHNCHQSSDDPSPALLQHPEPQRCPTPPSDCGVGPPYGAAGWAGAAQGNTVPAEPPPLPPSPHRGGGGHCKPAQDAGQWVGCHEGGPLDPHVLQAGHNQSHSSHHHNVPPPLPVGHGSAAFPTPAPRRVSLHCPPLDTRCSTGPCSSAHPGVPISTHCKFIVWILRAFLEGP